MDALLWTFVLCCAAVAAVNATCSEYEFACERRNGDTCLPLRWVCDGDNDCVDHSDEGVCGSPRTCPDNYFSCSSGRCIPDNWVCDGANDCRDHGTDEENCGSGTTPPTTISTAPQGNCSGEQFACQSNRRPDGCIPLHFVCDGDSSDCVDSSDESQCGAARTCPDRWHACASGRCVPESYVCDGGHDCPDGSDESQCNTSSTTPSTAHCAADEFACQSNRRSSGCIPRSWVCDGDHRDCVDDSDEQNCAQHHCAADEFACTSNRRSSGCIPLRWVCDGDSSDCVDGSDERNCGSTRTCPSGHFACDSGRCVPSSWVCDGANDCHDSGSDERNCHTSSSTPSTAHCAADEFACQSNRRSSGCIPRSWVCDGDHRDCVDDSDEQNCGTSATESTPSPVTPTTAPAAGCSEEQFACASRRWRGGCVPLAAVCDGRAGDCDDGSDEAHCGAARTCPERWFACASGRCVPPAMICDGRGQCPDAGDETPCGNPAAPIAVPQAPERSDTVGEARGGAVKLELPSWLATDQDAHFALSLAPMLRARTSRDKLDAQMAVLRLFRDLA